MDAIKRVFFVWMLFQAIQLTTCPAVKAASPDLDDGSGSEVGALRQNAAAVKAGDATAADEARGDGSQSAVSGEGEYCLKEGETCNPLNDKCCEGLYCFGGIVPTCFRKP